MALAMISLDYSTNTLKEWDGSEWRVQTFKNAALMESMAAFIEYENKQLYGVPNPCYSDVDR